jgi:hypothetical protein
VFEVKHLQLVYEQCFFSSKFLLFFNKNLGNFGTICFSSVILTNFANFGTKFAKISTSQI